VLVAVVELVAAVGLVAGEGAGAAVELVLGGGIYEGILYVSE